MMGMVMLLRRMRAVARGGSGGCGCWCAGRLAQEPGHLGVEPFGDLGGARVVVGGDLAGNAVVGDPGSPVRQLLDEEGDRRVGARVRHGGSSPRWAALSRSSRQLRRCRTL